MDYKRWWCLLSNTYSILNLGEFFHSENIGVLYNMLPPPYCVTGPRWVKWEMGDFLKLINNTVNHHDLTDYTSLSEKTTILTPDIFSLLNDSCFGSLIYWKTPFFIAFNSLCLPCFHVSNCVLFLPSITVVAFSIHSVFAPLMFFFIKNDKLDYFIHSMSKILLSGICVHIRIFNIFTRSSVWWGTDLGSIDNMGNLEPHLEPIKWGLVAKGHWVEWFPLGRRFKTRHWVCQAHVMFVSWHIWNTLYKRLPCLVDIQEPHSRTVENRWSSTPHSGHICVMQG